MKIIKVSTELERSVHDFRKGLCENRTKLCMI